MMIIKPSPEWEGAPKGRMRSKAAVIARKRVVSARPPLISQRAGPLTASPEGEAALHAQGRIPYPPVASGTLPPCNNAKMTMTI